MDLIQDKIDKYEAAVTALTEYFCIKQGLQLDFWVAGLIGEIVSCSEYFFNFSDIKFDMETEQPVDQIINWYNETVDFRMDKANDDKFTINYSSYCNGARYELFGEGGK